MRAIAYMEAFVTPLTWEDYDPQRRDVFDRLRSPAGEQMVLENNLFVEALLPGGIQRTLADDEMHEYRRPFCASAEDRLPTLVWPRQIPIDGAPHDVDDVVRSYSRWLARSEVSKLFINADPGALLTGRSRELCRTWPHQTEVTVAGKHFVQEDSPNQIAEAIRQFVQVGRAERIGVRSPRR